MESSHQLGKVVAFAKGRLRSGLRRLTDGPWIEALSIKRPALLRYARAKGKVWTYGEEVNLEIKAPIVGPTPPDFQQYVKKHAVPPGFVCEIPNAVLVGRFGVCLTQRGRLVVEEAGTLGMLKHNVRDTMAILGRIRTVKEVARRCNSRTARPDFNVAMSLIPRHPNVYGHWLQEDLPRLRAFEFIRSNTPLDPALLIPKNPPKWMVETLNLMGLRRSDWCEFGDEVATVGKLLVPRMNWVHSHSGTLQPGDRAWVANRMKKNCRLDEGGNGFSRRILLSRRDQVGRHITNLEEVKQELDRFGFQCYEPEKLSIRDQIRLFSQAEVIVSVHGSALTGLMFAERAKVLQIGMIGWLRVNYFLLANEFNLPYGLHMAQPVGGTEPGHSADLYVDAGRLATDVETLLKAAPVAS